MRWDGPKCFKEKKRRLRKRGERERTLVLGRVIWRHLSEDGTLEPKPSEQQDVEAVSLQGKWRKSILGQGKRTRQGWKGGQRGWSQQGGTGADSRQVREPGSLSHSYKHTHCPDFLASGTHLPQGTDSVPLQGPAPSSNWPILHPLGGQPVLLAEFCHCIQTVPWTCSPWQTLVLGMCFVLSVLRPYLGKSTSSPLL